MLSDLFIKAAIFQRSLKATRSFGRGGRERWSARHKKLWSKIAFSKMWSSVKDSFKKSPKAFMETVAQLPTLHLGRNTEHAGAEGLQALATHCWRLYRGWKSACQPQLARSSACCSLLALQSCACSQHPSPAPLHLLKPARDEGCFVQSNLLPSADQAELSLVSLRNWGLK